MLINFLIPALTCIVAVIGLLFPFKKRPDEDLSASNMNIFGWATLALLLILCAVNLSQVYSTMLESLNDKSFQDELLDKQSELIGEQAYLKSLTESQAISLEEISLIVKNVEGQTAKEYLSLEFKDISISVPDGDEYPRQPISYSIEVNGTSVDAIAADDALSISLEESVRINVKEMRIPINSVHQVVAITGWIRRRTTKHWATGNWQYIKGGRFQENIYIDKLRDMDSITLEYDNVTFNINFHAEIHKEKAKKMLN